MLDFFLLVNFFPCTPCNVGLYSLAGGKNELEKKNNIARGDSQKKIIERKNKTRLYCSDKDPFTLFLL
jgi:hypothetical protein